MKKGFTMIELIFVIVILGILASVAVPRLAGTKADAEISATVANLRTLVNDANVYYVAKGSFGTATNTAKWKDITNVPLTKNGGVPIDTESVTQEASLYIGGTRCIGVTLNNEVGTLPAYISFTKTNSNISSVCRQVQESESVKAYFNSKVGSLTSAMPIGSSTKLVR